MKRSGKRMKVSVGAVKKPSPSARRASPKTSQGTPLAQMRTGGRDA